MSLALRAEWTKLRTVASTGLRHLPVAPWAGLAAWAAAALPGGGILLCRRDA